MSNQLICDGCLKPIDQAKPYVTITATKVKTQPTQEGSPAPGGGLEVVDEAKTYDFHEDHAPSLEPSV